MDPSTIILGLLFLFGAAAPGQEESAEAQENQAAEERPGPSYTLADRWDEQWLRIFHRFERPDPDGPFLQRFEADLYRRYNFDIFVPEFPLGFERAWHQSEGGFRMWVQSLSEFELANRLQMSVEAPTWEQGYVQLRYDRREDRLTERNRLRFDIGQRNIADTNLSLALRFHPGFEKNDVDVELLASWVEEGLGTASLSVGALDPFINASFGLVEARGTELEEHVRQVDLPLMSRLELKTASFQGVRAEVYGGVVFPQHRRHRFPTSPAEDHERRRQALLGALLLEYAFDPLPLAVGVTGQAIDARMNWQYEGRSDREVQERTLTGEFYALSEPVERLYLEGLLRHTRRPQWERGPESSQRDDREWLLSLRTRWMATDVVGADLAYLRMHRHTEGPPQLRLDGQFNRFVTRVMLQFGDVWVSFGVGWSFDADTYVYDGGGMTLIYRPSSSERDR